MIFKCLKNLLKKKEIKEYEVMFGYVEGYKYSKKITVDFDNRWIRIQLRAPGGPMYAQKVVSEKDLVKWGDNVHVCLEKVEKRLYKEIIELCKELKG